MLSFQLIFVLISIIPLINTILEDDILYDIQWQSKLASPIESENNFIFTSKRKEIYSCVLPVTQTTETKPMENILLSEFEYLLEKIHSKKTCIHRYDPYWFYELCHGKHIRQFHEAKIGPKKKILHDFFLGYFHSNQHDFIENSVDQQIIKIHYKTINNRQIPTVSVRYTDGTNCDINSNKPRETNIFYFCDEKMNDAIVHFQEVSTCFYEMIVATSELCNLKPFSQPDPNRHKIDCFAKENAIDVPQNLKKLQYQQNFLVKKGQGAQFTLTNVDGTTYLISYDFIDGEQFKNVDLPNNPNFLQEFFSGKNCLTGGTSWWKYEICYGQHVIQFHDGPQQRTSILLGKWNREKHIQFRNENSDQKTDENFVSLFYTDGDLCETTKTSRVVEVKLKCSKSQPVTTYLVEPTQCSYVLGIESSDFCDLINFTDEFGIPDQDKFLKHIDE